MLNFRSLSVFFRKGFLLFFLFVLLFVLGLPTFARAELDLTVPYSPAKNLTDGLSLLVDRDSQIALGLSTVAVLTAMNFDDEAQAYFNGHQRIGNLNTLGNEVLGTGVAGALLAGGFWVVGELRNDARTAHSGQAQLETIFVTGVLTTALKYAANRERPDQTDRLAFPSGHVSYAFATAAVLQEFYGWKVGAPAFLLGALTAAGRMQDNRHWLSDTVGGAAVAIIVARAFSRSHLSTYEKSVQEKQTVQILPRFGSDNAGLALKWDF